MRSNERKFIFWHKRSMKTQISLHTHVFCSVFVVHMKTLHPWLSKIRPLKISIRLRKCAVWSDSSLSTCPRYVFWCCGSNVHTWCIITFKFIRNAMTCLLVCFLLLFFFFLHICRYLPVAGHNFTTMQENRSRSNMDDCTQEVTQRSMHVPSITGSKTDWPEGKNLTKWTVKYRSDQIWKTAFKKPCYVCKCKVSLL